MNGIISDISSTCELELTSLGKKTSQELQNLKSVQMRLETEAGELAQKQSSNEILTKELNASLLDLLKEEMEQVKGTLLEHAREMDLTNQQVMEIEKIKQESQILENKLKKFSVKKKVDAKFDVMLESLKKEMEGLRQQVQGQLAKTLELCAEQVKRKMDKKDLGHFLVKKVDTASFNAQISVFSESLLGFKKKVGLIHSEFKNLPKPKELSESQVVLKVQRKVKKDLSDELGMQVLDQLRPLRQKLEELALLQTKQSQNVEEKLTLKASREVIQDLLQEQAKINEFICAENVMARFKVPNFTID